MVRWVTNRWNYVPNIHIHIQGTQGPGHRNLALIGRTLTINRSTQHSHHGQQCVVILQRICLQMSGTENICAFFHYLCQLQLAFWLFLQNLCPKKCPGTLLCCALSVVTSLWLSLPGGEQEFVVLCSAPSVPQPVFTITERPLQGPSPSLKRLLALSHLRHYAKRVLTPR